MVFSCNVKTFRRHCQMPFSAQFASCFVWSAVSSGLFWFSKIKRVPSRAAGDTGRLRFLIVVTLQARICRSRTPPLYFRLHVFFRDYSRFLMEYICEWRRHHFIYFFVSLLGFCMGCVSMMMLPLSIAESRGQGDILHIGFGERRALCITATIPRSRSRHCHRRWQQRGLNRARTLFMPQTIKWRYWCAAVSGTPISFMPPISRASRFVTVNSHLPAASLRHNTAGHKYSLMAPQSSSRYFLRFSRLMREIFIVELRDARLPSFTPRPPLKHSQGAASPYQKASRYHFQQYPLPFRFSALNTFMPVIDDDDDKITIYLFTRDARYSDIRNVIVELLYNTFQVSYVSKMDTLVYKLVLNARLTVAFSEEIHISLCNIDIDF